MKTANVTAANDNVVQNDNTATTTKSYSFVEQLVIERQVWQDTLMRSSNDNLYEILGKCYGKYEEMCGTDTAAAKVLRSELADYINLNAIRVTKASHTLAKIIRCVFGDTDRRRVSTYSIVLRTALSAKTKACDIPAFIKEHGGVQEIKLAKGNGLSTKAKAEIAQKSIDSMNLGEIHNEALATALDASKVGQQVVFVATQQASGKFIIHAATASATAFKIALACHYSANKVGIIAAAAEKKIASNDESLAAAINKAAA